jgi:hypothetical protein
MKMPKIMLLLADMQKRIERKTRLVKKRKRKKRTDARKEIFQPWAVFS